MSYKRVLTIQDISCFGQCSLTVALPIISACGHETVILPSAVLSTHTAGFSGFTVRDLSADIPAISAHWEKEGIDFDAFYTGYLGSPEQIDYVLDIFKRNGRKNSVKIVDPAMADGGKLYPAFDENYVNEMKRLSFSADIILPNITEACFLTGYEYRENYDEEYIKGLIGALHENGAKTVVLTGVGYTPDTTGVCVYKDGKLSYYKHEKLARSCHGTGDVYASAFVGAYLNGKDEIAAAKIAADYTVLSMKKTADDLSHTYGVKFEKAIPDLIKMLDLG